ncbi:MAG TPA: hypothetical protein GX010_01505 [Erysipelotrichaceae bacterium]|nr:hypothetical protein [Erysipelotrichaceae bacterium]
MKRKYVVLATSVGVAVVLGALVFTAGGLMNAYSRIMDGYLGAGDMIVNKHADSEDWEGNYIEFECKNVDESFEYATRTNKRIAAEGITLLKNEKLANGKNLLPLAAGSKLTLLGRNCGHHVTAPTDDVATRDGGVQMGVALQEAGFDLNMSAWNYYKGMSQVNNGSGEINPADEGYQTNVAATYDTYGSGTALILLRRSYSEGSDPAIDMGDAENNRTALSLSANELDLIKEACAHFQNVVMAISSPNAMELGFLLDGANYTDPFTNQTYDFSKVKGAYWIGGIGITGAESFAKILKGEINPSGHLVDTYVRDNLNDIPTSINFGEFKYTNVQDAPGDFYHRNNYTVEYEEGIYVGYRYFETAAYEASKGNYAGFDYDGTVVYPFGYGLSYTDFKYEYVGNPSYDRGTETYTFKVKVTNTGAAAGKTPVQIYVSAPYTKGGIEKSHVVLGGFTKTDIIAPGASSTVEVEVQKDYIASYDYKVNKCYVIEAGDYLFYLSDNAHSWAEIRADDTSRIHKIHMGETIYKGDKKRASDKVAAENLFDRDLNWKFKEYNENTVGSGYCTNLTRANFKASYPTAPVDGDLVANDYLLECFKVYEPSADYSANTISPYHDIELFEEEQLVEQNRGTLQLADMRGVDFYDESWKTFIDQLSLEELQTAFLVGGWGDRAIESVGVPATSGGDSPSGIISFRLKNTRTHYPYCAEVLLTATWNVELARAYGDAMAEEAQAQRGRTGGQAFNYLFGPGANTHRTPFGGRNHEYYSEDSLIAGKMLAAEASGAGEKGLIMLPKHCALNEQETVRQGRNDSNHTTYTSFVTEQGLREIYMRPWEIYAKEAKRNVRYYNDNGEFETVEMTAASALMLSYNRIGGVWSGGSPIIYGILREECGFIGTCFTDAGGTKNEYSNTDFGLMTGGVTSCLMDSPSGFKDGTSNTAIYRLKEAAHYKLYNVANGNALLGITPGSYITYTMSPWQIGLAVSYSVYGLIVAALAALTVFLFVNKAGDYEKVRVVDEE